jgi:hypothetical protein
MVANASKDLLPMLVAKVVDVGDHPGEVCLTSQEVLGVTLEDSVRLLLRPPVEIARGSIISIEGIVLRFRQLGATVSVNTAD